MEFTARRQNFKATHIRQSTVVHKRQQENARRRHTKAAAFAKHRLRTGTAEDPETDASEVSEGVGSGVHLHDMTTRALQVDVERLQAALCAFPPASDVVHGILGRWNAWWHCVRQTTIHAATANTETDDDGFDWDYPLLDVDVDAARTAFLALMDTVVVALLPTLASGLPPKCLLAALNLLHGVLDDVTISSDGLVPYLLCVIRGVDGGADDACVAEAARCLTAVMAVKTAWVDADESAVAAVVRAFTLRTHGGGVPSSYYTALLGVVTEAVRNCSPERLHALLPFLFGVVQSAGLPVVARNDALDAIIAVEPMDEAAFTLLRSSGVLSYCIRSLTAADTHAALLQRMLQFVGMFTDEHATTTQWAVEGGLVPALVALCADPAALPPAVSKEVLWIVADLSCSTASIRGVLFAEPALCAFPATVLALEKTRHNAGAGIRAAAASVLTIVMEDADVRMVQYACRLGYFRGFAYCLADGLPCDVAGNVLTVLEDAFQAWPEVLTDFVAHDGIAAMAAVQREYVGHAVAYRAHTVAETYALTD